MNKRKLPGFTDEEHRLTQVDEGSEILICLIGGFFFVAALTFIAGGL